jgi:hypothetical protein
MRAIAAMALSLLLVYEPLPTLAQSVRPDPELTEGLRQLREGDYEGAVTTLRRVVERLSTDRSRSGELVQALLHLGIAHVALDQTDAAKARFGQALTHDPTLTLSPERFSPKVIRTFEAAREEARKASPPPEKKGHGGRTALIVIGGAAAAAAGIALATGGGVGANGPPTLANARFGTTVLVCENGSNGVPLSFTVLVDAVNPASAPLIINSATTTIHIVESSIASEIGFASSQASTVMPATLGGGARDTVQVQSSLRCGNGEGDPPRINVWKGMVTFSTSAGLFTLDMQDELRINIP